MKDSDIHSKLNQQICTQIKDDQAHILNDSQRAENAEKQNRSADDHHPRCIRISARKISHLHIQFIIRLDLYEFKALKIALPVLWRAPVKILHDYRDPRHDACAGKSPQNAFQFRFQTKRSDQARGAEKHISNSRYQITFLHDCFPFHTGRFLRWSCRKSPRWQTPSPATDYTFPARWN